MGLRLSETLSLQVGDIDGKRKQVHIRRGKGHKDRFVPLPDLTLHGLRELWRKHNHPKFFVSKRQRPHSSDQICKKSYGQGRRSKSHESGRP